MKVVKTKKIEGCMEGTNVFDILFDCVSDMNFVKYLGQLGEVTYNDQMAKPYYKVICRGKYTLRGSLGNHTVRITLPGDGSLDQVDDVVNLINNYPD